MGTAGAESSWLHRVKSEDAGLNCCNLPLGRQVHLLQKHGLRQSGIRDRCKSHPSQLFPLLALVEVCVFLWNSDHHSRCRFSVTLGFVLPQLKATRDSLLHLSKFQLYYSKALEQAIPNLNSHSATFCVISGKLITPCLYFFMYLKKRGDKYRTYRTRYIED